jgi:hypothetical protein
MIPAPITTTSCLLIAVECPKLAVKTLCSEPAVCGSRLKIVCNWMATTLTWQDVKDFIADLRSFNPASEHPRPTFRGQEVWAKFDNQPTYPNPLGFFSSAKAADLPQEVWSQIFRFSSITRQPLEVRKVFDVDNSPLMACRTRTNNSMMRRASPEAGLAALSKTGQDMSAMKASRLRKPSSLIGMPSTLLAVRCCQSRVNHVSRSWIRQRSLSST